MATKNIVPRGDNEGGLGSSDRAWGEGYFNNLHCTGTFFMPLTTTADRPATAEIGATMFDTDIGALIIWDGTGWVEAGGASPTTLNLIADPTEGGTVTGGGTYDKNSDAVIEAVPAAEYTFSQWEGNTSGINNITENPTFVSMTQSWSIRAKFLINQYTLTAQAGTGGSTTGTGDYDFGSYGTITAIPYPEYDFVNWTGGSGGDIIAPNNAITTVLVDQDKTVTANFALKTYDVTVNHLLDIDASGTYTPDTSGTSGTFTGSATGVEHGTVHPVTFSPNPGYQIVGWELDSASNTLQTISYDVVGATSDNATLTFEKSGVQSDNPSISIETGDTLVINNNASGQPSSFNDTFMLNDGSTSGTYTIVANDPGPQDIVITFDGSTDLATLIANGADGTGTTPYPVTINSGDGGAIGMAAQSITITGGTNVFTLNIKDSSGADVATESGGVLTLGVYDDTETYTYYSPEFPGDLGAITISDGFADSSIASTTTTVTENRTINLRTSIQTYSSDITVADFDYQGTPEVPGTATIDNSTPTYGSSVTITATSSNSSKYEFDYWGGASASLLTDINNPSATIDPVEADIVLVANFKLVQYTLTVDYVLYEGDGTTVATNPDALNNISSSLSANGTITSNYGTADLPIDYAFSANASLYVFMGWVSASDVVDDQNQSTQLSNELTSDITVTANFKLATQELYVAFLHPEDATYGVTPHNFINYNYDVLVDGSSIIDGGDIASGTGTVSGSTNLELESAFGGPKTNGTLDIYIKTVDAFSTVDLSSDFTNSNRGLIQWGVYSTSGSTISDSESPSTTVSLVGDTLVVIETGLTPLSTFLVEGDLYFGETIELSDVSTAPSGDGFVVSATYTNDQGLPFSSEDTAIRFFAQQDMYIELDGVGDNIFDFNEEFSILYYGDQFSVDNSKGHDTFSRGHFALGGYEGGFNQLLHYIVDPSGASTTNYRCAGTNMPASLKTSNGYLNKGHVFRHSPTSGTYGTFNMRGLNPAGSITSYGTGLATNYGAPSTFVSDSSDASTHKFIIGKTPIVGGQLGKGPCPVKYRDMLFINRRITDAEVDEFLAMDPGTYDQLSYYSEVVDWVEFGAQTYPNITGKKGVVSGSLKGSAISETNFKSLTSLTLPIGSPGDTTGSIDVTLTVTDDQGLTDTETQPITYGPAPLESGDVIHSITVTADDGNELLRPALFYQADITSEAENNEVFTFTASSSGEQLSSTSTGQGPNEITEQTYT